MRLNAASKGFTLLEMVITASLVAALMSVGFLALRSQHGLFRHVISRHVLEEEQGQIVDLIGALLRRADPATLSIESSPEAPWSQLRFSAAGHRYAFYGQNGMLWLREDEHDPKSLSSHWIGMQFAVTRARLPAVLTWSLTLGTPGRNSAGPRATYSAAHFLEALPE